MTKCLLPLALSATAFLVAAAMSALAAGDLHIYNYGDYTNPKLIQKFEKQYDVKVTLDDYDSNETMLSKVRAGNSGYDIVVPSGYTVAIMIKEGLLAKVEPDQMSNFRNMKPAVIDVYWDKGRHYSVPWQLGTTSFVVNTEKYKGDINSYAILFDPPTELKGQINMLGDMPATMHAAERYLGLPRCGVNKANLKKVNDLLLKAKTNWKTLSYDAITKMTSGDVLVSQIWNGAAYRIRQKVPSVKYAYPKKGIEGWMDNVVVLKNAENVENSKLFMNFIMEPENAALNSEFTGYGNGIKGSDKYLSVDFVNAPEIKPPPGSPKPEYVRPCDPAVVRIYNQIWTNLRK